MTHFYTLKGGGVETRHFVTAKSGDLRPSTVRDAKKALKSGEIWYPSVTTILGVFAKPGLNTWMQQKGMETAVRVMKERPHLTQDQALKIAQRELKEELDKAPQAGTDFHQVMEDYMNDLPVAPEWHRHCENVRQLLLDNCGEQEWETEKYFCDTRRGFAGCADLVSPEWVIDYKTKEYADKFKPGKMAWTDHARQLAAYDIGIPAPAPRKAANVFICLETAEVDFHQHDSKALRDGEEDFMAALRVYQRNNYNPLEVK